MGSKRRVTIYHWDLPQKLQDRGGGTNPGNCRLVYRVRKILYRELGDLVDYWITLNEPYCTALPAIGRDRHAPGYHDYSMALQATHHLLMAHGAAVKAYRDTGLSAKLELR